MAESEHYHVVIVGSGSTGLTVAAHLAKKLAAGSTAVIESATLIDQGKERRSKYLIKRDLLPKLYWHGMLRGRA